VRAARGRRLIFIASFFLFFALLVVLIGSVSQLQLAPGKSLPLLYTTQPDTEAAESGPGGSVNSERIGSLFFALVLVCLVSLVIGAIFSRRLRRSLLIMSAIALAVFLALMWVKPPKEVPFNNVAMRVGALFPGQGGDPIRVEIPEVSPPNWAVILTAVGAAAVAAGLAALLVFKFYPAFRRRRSDETLLEALANRARDAADRIRAGVDLADAVRRCYKEMVELLCTKASVPGVAVLTPREFAGALRARGMEDEHVDHLTAIFEQVRYGGRPGAAFADEATACLDAIRVAYAPSSAPS